MREAYTLIQNKLGFYEVSPKPSPEVLKQYYNDKYYGTEKINNQYNYDYTNDEILHKQIESLETIFYLNGKVGSLLEIGFGEGFFLNHFHSLGWQINGIDFTVDGLRQHHSHLIKEITVDDIFEAIESLIDNNIKYDLVVCNNVLEHVIDPLSLLAQIYQLLTPEGIIRLVVPNDYSWVQKEIVERGCAEDNYWVCPPDHLNYFTVNSLSNILSYSKFDIIDILGTFPIDFFLLNPDTNYQKNPLLGRNCHFAKVAFETALVKQSIEQSIEFRRGCAKANVGRDLVVYCRISSAK
jgi:2-polyprenyl-3-methyl-5-hydroxy-6-metoxy-1,4-benzoquinol methylase